MFEKYKTHELLDFLNSIKSSDRVGEFIFLYTDALNELRNRSTLLAQTYEIEDK